MSKKIYVLIDHAEGVINGASWETLVMAQAIASSGEYEVSAVLLGQNIGNLGEQLSSVDLTGVILAEDDRLREYDPDTYKVALRQVVEQDQPFLVLMAHTYQNIDFAPKFSAALGKALVTDTIGFRASDSELLFVRQMFRNKLDVEVRIKSAPPWFVSMQSGAYSRDNLAKGQAPVSRRSLDLQDAVIRRRPLEKIAAMKGKVDLTKAESIVGVGRGIKKSENLQIIRDLAEVLDAEIGASRPVVDNDWLERERQIGSSGQSVSPKLYIACGISGAIQHIVGMKNSNCIVAINTDPNAPIFNVATYGIVGDLFEIVPELTRQLKEIS